MPGAQDVSPARASQTATPGPKRTRRSPDDPSDSASSDAESASGEGAAAGALVGVELLAEGCGTIQKIELTDFMSHKNFKIELGPDVNFITGPNGSGKSSIVTALQVALGMKAFDTKRATSLGELIRNGANGCAVVRVTLSNKGSDAYKPSEYGDAIVVERIIGPGNKGSSHRLLSKAGKVVEKTAAAVKGLCELWHLYVDNPCCVLDQENAKAFLNSTPEEKYRFALRASDLMTVHQNYELELNTRLQAKDDLAQLSKQLPSIEQAARVAQKELDEIQRLDTLHEQLKASEGEVFWAGVIELEDKLKKDEEVVGKRRAQLAAAEEELRAVEHDASKHTQNMEALTARVNAAKAALDEAKLAGQNAAKAVKNARGPIKKAVAEKSAHLEDVKTCEAHIKATRKEIEKLRAAQASKSSSEAARHAISAISAKEGELESLGVAKRQANLAQLFAEKEELETVVGTIRASLEPCARACKDKESDVAALQKTLAQPASATPDPNHWLIKFGSWMPDLYKRVQDGASRFTAPPILMATKVKLLPGEKKWATALDSVLARALGAFLVNASSDSQLLFRLAAEAGVPKGALQVTVKKFTGVRHTVPAPPAGFKTMLSLLQISDDNCANALIDSNRCEQLVVVEDIAEVQRKFWLGSQRARETPRGLISAVDVKGVNYSVRGGSEVREATRVGLAVFGLLAEAAGPRSATANRAEIERALQTARTELAQLQHERDVFTTDLKNAETQLRAASTKVDQFERHNRDTQARMTQLEDELEELRASLPQQGTDRSELQVQELMQVVAGTEARIREDQELVAGLDELIAKAELDVVPQEQAERAAREAFTVREREVEEQDQALDAFHESYVPYMEKLHQAKERVAQEKDRLMKAELAATQSSDKAKAEEQDARMHFPERVNTTRTFKQAEAHRRSLQALVAKEQARADKESSEDPAQRIARVKATAKRANERVAKVKGDLEVVTGRLRALKKEMRLRKKSYALFRDRVETVTKRIFMHVLKNRGNNGVLEFVKESEDGPGRLNMSWSRSGDDMATQGEGEFDHKQLSGGERSYTTISLLIAMGANCNTPFRVMDEFDVFMDAQSRQIAINELVQDSAPLAFKLGQGHRADQLETLGRLRGPKQNIFITPLEIDKAVPELAYVKKLRLAPVAASFGTKGGA